MSPIIVTGAAGFIGFHTVTRLLLMGHTVIGIDNLNDYYDPKLKDSRLELLKKNSSFSFIKADINELEICKRIFADYKPNYVVHLAAQAGVRYSLINPHAYIESNISGFVNILECCRQVGVMHFVYASSSSVYGSNRKLPFAVSDNVDHPVSLYAATKKSNELIAHCYSHLFKIPTTGLRFFTVYGPWGRPDMALYLFAKAMKEGLPIEVYNHGKMRRDFTYIDDIVQGICKVLFNIAQPEPEQSQIDMDPSRSTAPYKVYNIGNNVPIALLDAIELLEKEMGVVAQKKFMEMQPGDVECTFADIDAIRNAVGYEPSTPFSEGIKRFVDWFKTYYA